MAIAVTEPAVVEQKTANYFEIAHYDVSNRIDGPTLEIWWNAIDRQVVDTVETKTIVKNCGPVAVSGADLVALCADADARTQAYKAANVPAGQAYQLGQRDALYATLQAQGHIPEAA